MIELLAPAKLTWFLEITGRRDDGMHELRAEMLSVDFCDRLEIDEDGDYLHLEGPYSNVVANEDNLVARALQLVDRRAGVTLHKFVPPGGGLGGGSSDAGAILRWAGGVSADAAVTLGRRRALLPGRRTSPRRGRGRAGQRAALREARRDPHPAQLRSQYRPVLSSLRRTRGRGRAPVGSQPSRSGRSDRWSLAWPRRWTGSRPPSATACTSRDQAPRCSSRAIWSRVSAPGT